MLGISIVLIASFALWVGAFLWGSRSGAQMGAISLGTVLGATAIAIKPQTPWRGDFFRMYTGIDSAGVPETRFQKAILAYTSSRQNRTRIAVVGSVSAVWPWFLGGVSLAFGGKPISANLGHAPLFVHVFFGALLGFFTACLEISAQSKFVLANRRLFEPPSESTKSEEPEKSKEESIPEDFGSVGYFLRARGISRGRAALWLVILFALGMGNAYLKGRAKRLERERAAVDALAIPYTPAWPGTESRQKWVKEPDGYRGLKWGSNEASTRGLFPELQCEEATPTSRLCTRLGESFISGVTTTESLFFENDTLQRVRLNFDGKQYSRVKSKFIRDYGAPSISKKEDFDVGGTAPLENERLQWAGKNVTVTLEYFRGEAHFWTHDYWAEHIAPKS